jgi:hypothetical protein
VLEGVFKEIRMYQSPIVEVAAVIKIHTQFVYFALGGALQLKQLGEGNEKQSVGLYVN